MSLELLCVGEGILQKLHDRDDARGLVLDVLNRRTGLADIRQQQGAMAVVELTAEEIEALDGNIEPAVYTGPGMTTVGGPRPEVELLTT